MLAQILKDILDERQRQDVKWGLQSHPLGGGTEYDKILADTARSICDGAFAKGQGTWLHILEEEFREAFAESDPAKVRAEMTQVAAVAIAIMEYIDRNSSNETS